jgi:hypothetical protein
VWEWSESGSGSESGGSPYSIPSTDITLGPNSKSLTEWGSSHLHILSPFPINVSPTGRYNQASFSIIEKNHPHGFPTVKERRFMHHFMMIHQDRFAWNETQKGLFCKDFFPPVHMPITKHVPWVLPNMPIPPGIYNAVLDVVRKKITAGVYKQSNLSY